MQFICLKLKYGKFNSQQEIIHLKHHFRTFITLTNSTLFNIYQRDYNSFTSIQSLQQNQMCVCDHVNDDRFSFNTLTQQALLQLKASLGPSTQKRQALKQIQHLDIDFPKNMATTVFTNGTIFTMDENKKMVEAVAIRHNKIIKVGTFKQIQPFINSKTQVVDLKHKTMLPGFIDPHIHMFFSSFRQWIDLGPFENKNKAEVKQKLIEAIKKANPNHLLACLLYDPEITPGQFDVSRKALDQLSDKIGIYILQANGHVAHVNSAAFRLLGIDKTAKDPPHGRFDRDENGEFTGEVHETAVNAFALKLPPVTAQQYITYFLQFLKYTATLGCTTLHDCGIGFLQPQADLAVLIQAYNRKPAVRYSGMLVSTRWDVWEKKKLVPNFTDNDLRIKGMKFWADGSTQLGTAFMRENYKRPQFKKGFPNYTKETLFNQLKKANQQGWQIGIHANGDAGIDLALQALEQLNKVDLKHHLRHRIQHSTICHPSQLQRMKHMNVTPSFLIGHLYYYGHVFQDLLGKQRANLMDPLKTAFQCGLKPTIHSDYNCQPINPLRCVHNAVTRKMKDTGEVINPSQCVTPYQALQAITINAAWQSHMEDIVGSISQGKMADFVILDQDPTKIQPDNILNIKVLQTWMDGKITHNIWTDNNVQGKVTIQQTVQVIETDKIWVRSKL